MDAIKTYNHEKESMYHKIKKTVIINRGVPASGKSTMSAHIKDVFNSYNYQVGIHSTDDYFIKNGKYVFDIKKASANHGKNQSAFLKDLKNGVDIVICDNTNISPAQTFFYTKAAKKFGYYIIYISFHPRDLESHVASQFLTQDPNLSHHVPKNIIARMIGEYQMYHSIFDNLSQDKNTITMSFDEDKVIEINSNQFQQKKCSIGLDILNLIRKDV